MRTPSPGCSAIYLADTTGSWEETTPSFDVLAFGDKGKIVARIPLELLGEGDPADWAYAGVVLSQEGYPSAGVRRVRDVEPTVEQWRLGGAPDDINHTRIVDVAYAEPGVQEDLLSGYPAMTTGTIDQLEPEDYPVIPLALP